jgi:phosphoglycolate phosphatase
VAITILTKKEKGFGEESRPKVTGKGIWISTWDISVADMVECDGATMRWKNVILDFDGTLVDSQSIFAFCVNELGEAFGYGRIEFGLEYREKSAREMLADVLRLLPEQVPYWAKEFNAQLRRNMGKAVTFKGMREVLSVLRKDYWIGIVTSNAEETVRHILTRDGIEKVDFIWADAPIFDKDRAIEGLLADQTLSPEETIYVGDEMRDIDACRKVGIKIIAVSWGFNSKAVLERKEPDYLVETPMELLTILETPSH